MLALRSINIANFVRDFNERTSKMKKGIPLPIRCKATSDKTFDLDIHLPPATFFIKQAAGQQIATMKGEIAGYITLRHIYEIAKMKLQDPPNALKTHEQMCQQLVGVAKSCGIEVVRNLDPEEYGKFLEQRRIFIAEQKAEIAAAREAKMLRSA